MGLEGTKSSFIRQSEQSMQDLQMTAHSQRYENENMLPSSVPKLLVSTMSRESSMPLKAKKKFEVRKVVGQSADTKAAMYRSSKQDSMTEVQKLAG